ncbi:MAG: DUF4974 domain-containing protein [Bacteroidetes bacterium]|nr:MAG: DUF4974 domain-containing protein [Bacteroidota bacterium]
MADEQKHIEHFDLVVKYLSGEASDSEVKLLEAWVLESAGNKAAFNEIRQAWLMSGIQENHLGIDVDEEWNSVEEVLFSNGKVVKMQPRRGFGRYMGIAAAVIALVAVALWVFLPNGGSVISTEDQVVVNELPDGSQVSLNQYAMVAVKADFDEEERRVQLKGDAFFEVERDPEKPFIVATDEVEVKVLGTSFYVDSREELPKIEVIVESGVVEVSAKGNSIILNAGETGTYNKTTEELLKQSNEDENFLAWKTDTIIFENEPLDIVIHSLNRKFHSQIEMDIRDTSKCYINTTFENKSLEAILKIIEKTHGISTRREGDRIIFTGDSCL